MKTFVRMSKLSDIVGRSDYISNPDRQEHIVAAKSYANWKPYQAYERQHQRSSEPNNEGRELIIALPNEWQKLDNLELTSRMNDLAQRLLPGKNDYQWAVHWNKAHTNLHVHLIFSERNPQYSSSVWDRDIYLTQDGKVARRKADRAVDKNGNVKPPVHRKGEPKTQSFSPKDKKFKSKQWLEDAKQTVAAYFRYYRIPVEDPALLHQYHEGKGSDAPAIREKNKNIRRINAHFKQLQNLGYVFPPYSDNRFKKMQKAALQSDFKFNLNHIASFANHSPKIESIIFKDRDTAIKLFQQLLSERIQTVHTNIPDKGHCLYYAAQHKARVEQLAQKLQPPPTPTTEKKAPAAAAPVPAQQFPQKAPEQPKKPRVSISKLIELKNDYTRQCCIYYYLQLVQHSTAAQKDYDAAMKLTTNYSTASSRLVAMDNKIRHTLNPIKKHKLRTERDAAADQLGNLASELRSTLKISLVYEGTEFNCRTATEEHRKAIFNYAYSALDPKQKAADAEKKTNRMIDELSKEHVTEQSVNAALAAFQAACKEVPDDQKNEAHRRLQDSPVPPIDYSTSEGRRTAHNNITKTIATFNTSNPQIPHFPTSEDEEPTQSFNLTR